jgi:hypothetical protein
MLAQEESRIFEELLSRLDSLGDEQMLKVGVTPGMVGQGFAGGRGWHAPSLRH